MHGAPTTEDTSHGDTDTKTADKIGTDNVFAAASRSRFRSEHVARGIQQKTLLQSNIFHVVSDFRSHQTTSHGAQLLKCSNMMNMFKTSPSCIMTSIWRCKMQRSRLTAVHEHKSRKAMKIASPNMHFLEGKRPSAENSERYIAVPCFFQ